MFGQGRVRLQTELDKGSVLYIKIKNDSPYMPKFKGLKLLEKWQNNQLLSYKVQQKSIEIEGRLLALSVANAGLTELDVKEAKMLKTLYCAKNKLQSLNLSSNSQLKELDCALNKLSTIDLRNNQQLTYLNLYGNELSKLDLSSNKKLLQLYCGANKLQSLSLDEQKSLELLNCGSNELRTLALNPCPKLEEIYCGNNQLVRVNIPINIRPKALFLNQNKLQLISLGSAKRLQRFWCFGNLLGKQELKVLIGFLPTHTSIKGDFRLAQKGEAKLIGSEELEELKNKAWNAIQTSSDTWSDLSYYNATEGTPIQTFTQTKNLKIYPNPLKGSRLFIEGSQPFALARLYTMQGQLVLNKRLDSQGALVLDFKSLKLSGYYLLQVGSVSQLLCIGL